MQPIKFAVMSRLSPDKYLLNKDGISQDMRVWFINNQPVDDAGIKNKYYKKGVELNAQTLEDVVVGTILRGDSFGKDIINADELLKSFSGKEVMDWVSILLQRTDREDIVKTVHLAFNEITRKTTQRWVPNERRKEAGLLERTGYARLKQLEALASSQLETAGTGGSKEALKR